MKVASRQYYQPQRILLDSRIQLLMLGKTTMKSIGVDLEPYSYQILTLMGESMNV
jgi:hypothetical protein